MSATKAPVLSTTLAIFHGLQDDIKTILCNLATNVSPAIKKGLLDAHEKLSEYYYKYNESLLILGLHVCHSISSIHASQLIHAVLDPRISYDGMRLNYKSDTLLLPYLESSKDQLQDYYDTHYANKYPVPSQITELATMTPRTSAAPLLLPQKNFTSHFHWKVKVVMNELDKYFKLSPEDFETCNPVHWWMGWCAQFPNLFWLAHDILCIPGVSIIKKFVGIGDEHCMSGSAVAVKHIFSGGHDTTSLHHASLNPKTIS